MIESNTNQTDAPTSSFDKVSMRFSPLDGRPFSRPILLHALRGFFFKVIGSIDPQLADRTHAPESVSSFALQHKVSRTCMDLHCTMFSRELATAMRGYLKADSGLIFNLGHETVRLEEITIESIAARSLLQGARLPDRFRLVFRTPTYFKQPGGRIVLFPDLVVMCKHLCTIWNELLPGATRIDPEELLSWVAVHVQLTSYQLQTSMVTIGGVERNLTGFKGWANFKVLPHEDTPEQANAFWALFQLAVHSNIGGSRTAGFGQVACVYGNDGDRVKSTPLKTQ